MKKNIILLCIMGLLLALCGCSAPAREQTFFAMDTVMTFRLEGDRGGAAFSACTAEIERLESLLSVTRPESEIAALNGMGEAALSAETRALLTRAQEFSAETEGAFCLTLYPVSAAWGFFSKEYRVPTAETLAALRPLVDDRALRLSENAASLPAGAGVDLGGIVKGYAGARLAALLRERGITHYFLSLGGNVQVGGGRPNGEPWRIGIADPAGGDPVGVIRLREGAVVTSGGYQRYFTENGKTYHHILDPRTLCPAESGLLSATAVTADGTAADALSTAFFVMGEEKALAYCAEHPEVQCVLITADGRIRVSAALQASFTPLNKEYAYEEG